jgi:dihydroorotase
VHLCRLSSGAGLELVRAAKAEGLPVTCDVGAHHVHLTDADINFFDPNARMTPPFRTQRDRDAIRAALADGTIDALVSDHTPVDEDAKTLPFAEAEPGATGLELLLSLALKWGSEHKQSLPQTLSKITSAPVGVLGDSLGSLAASAGKLVEGGVADLCLFDPETRWIVRSGNLRSQGKHTPFGGYEVPGRVRCTLVAGAVAYETRE